MISSIKETFIKIGKKLSNLYLNEENNEKILAIPLNEEEKEKLLSIITKNSSILNMFRKLNFSEELENMRFNNFEEYKKIIETNNSLLKDLKMLNEIYLMLKHTVSCDEVYVSDSTSRNRDIKQDLNKDIKQDLNKIIDLLLKQNSDLNQMFPSENNPACVKQIFEEFNKLNDCLTWIKEGFICQNNIQKDAVKQQKNFFDQFYLKKQNLILQINSLKRNLNFEQENAYNIKVFEHIKGLEAVETDKFLNFSSLDPDFILASNQEDNDQPACNQKQPPFNPNWIG